MLEDASHRQPKRGASVQRADAAEAVCRGRGSCRQPEPDGRKTDGGHAPATPGGQLPGRRDECRRVEPAAGRAGGARRLAPGRPNSGGSADPAEDRAQPLEPPWRVGDVFVEH